MTNSFFGPGPHPDGLRILFVAMAESVHTARWISQLYRQGWDIHVFPSHDENIISPDLKHVTIHHSIYTTSQHANPSIKHRGFHLWFPVKNRVIGESLRAAVQKIYTSYRVKRLARLIRQLKPDIIHSLEFQHSGYLLLEARKLFDEDEYFPPWIASSWGNDLYLFGRLAQHEARIREMFQYVDYFISDCNRDIPLAKKLGFQGTVLGAILAGGGYDLEHISHSDASPPSQRKQILIKGRQSFSGRALFALRALNYCVDVLQDYEIKVYFADESVRIAAELLAQNTGLNISIFENVAHDEWLKLLNQARIHIGVAISDGTPLAMLECLLFGVFPIQSYTACVDEWLTDGVTGLIVSPEDVHEIAAAIRCALTDDALVDAAATINHQLAIDQLDYRTLQEEVIQLYRFVARGRVQ